MDFRWMFQMSPPEVSIFDLFGYTKRPGFGREILRPGVTNIIGMERDLMTQVTI